ncbi:MAG: PAS domain-containing sensor histidine kinase [Sphingobacteriales bacterium]|nr:MAG: PAS domain-containing sensor histidine kinase [Sphingobacteriales bacterium]
MFDPETFNFVIVNDAAVEKYGYTEQELLSMTIMDIRPPEEHERVRNIVSSRPTETVNMVGGHFKHKKKSGEIIDVEVYSSPLVLNGKLFRTVIAIDVTEKQLFEQQMTKAIVRTQEEERYEIGSELHDNVCQLLATSQMLLGMLKGSLEPGAMKIYDQTKQYITLALEDIRNLSHRLAPAFYEDATMEDTFKMLIGSTKMASSFDIKLQFGKSLRRHAFTMDVQLNLYRVLQEQLRNITKYANATSVKINVDIDDTDLRMQIADDGVGFDVGAVNEGIGLANMRRRAELFQGNFEITSSPGNGCRVTITIPLKASLSQTPVRKT